ncbi:vWA domain-containing protein [Dyadobacter psychrotolerans]|uniref:DUF3520 domain-containing protein n=1 Tax=Dyadobacter psychrotolerans TaxID=2541721 RepID=A0A4R5DHK9_9BACT|nr:VWA domain-containing protein [Dyadobacter psychrotolerans]TDE10245.1 DUF3520 domain-containing protein [Dyadobacter psychrotolerans]
MKPNQLLLIVLLLCGFSQSPERKITGIVTDRNQTPLPGVTISVKGFKLGTTTDRLGRYQISIPVTASKLVFSFVGYLSKEVSFAFDNILNVTLTEDYKALQEVVVVGYGTHHKRFASAPMSISNHSMNAPVYSNNQYQNTENYKSVNENIFQLTCQQAVTTFSVDVDRASYSNVRRFLNSGQMPPEDAVRIEEMINYFDYDYPQPKNEHPVSVTTELSDSPWNRQLKLLRIVLQAKTISTAGLPASNLVFLVDVSGSMMDFNKLPLLKNAFKLLVDQLRPQDKVSIVVYAGAAGLVLEPTSGNEKAKIREALDNLSAGGSTAGGAGIELAYKIARENFLPKGNNRVILATDGDFNVGVSSEGALERLIEEKRKDGVYLSIAGFGMGNYKDSHIETLADKGNGNYAYIDNIQEARKVFVSEFGGTLFTVAKDVKLQIEFNPAKMKAYRLIGYENRALKNEEFHDDKKDAGEMGSGHTVTAIYEIVPANVESRYLTKTDELKYQKTAPSENAKSNELLTLKIRYKNPESDKSILFQTVVSDMAKPMNSTSDNFRFAASVAEFGLLLRKSEFKGTAGYDHVISLAQSATGKDQEGYRSEFISLVKAAKLINEGSETAKR